MTYPARRAPRQTAAQQFSLTYLLISSRISYGKRAPHPSPGTRPAGQITIESLSNNSVLILFYSRICNKHLLWYIVLLFVPPIPLLINPTSGQKKEDQRPSYSAVGQHRNMIKLGWLDCSNTRLAKSHVEMSCKLFCL